MSLITTKSNRDLIKSLIAKYGGIVPRYTSYPTAPEWKDDYDHNQFEAAIARSNQRQANSTNNSFSLYLHIPFCESQCHYCGCNVIISPEHGIEHPYIARMKEEITYLADRIDTNRSVLQLAWGGGTPTYLSPRLIEELYTHLQNSFKFLKTSHDQNDKHEYSIEIDPRVTTTDHLRVLYALGFNRLSMGIQDFNDRTQQAVNRVQPFEMVQRLVGQARSIGFNSINFDLIYGLPYQTVSSFADTITKVKILDPDRIALFNYAHIPSVFPFQRKYIDESTLPDQEEKMMIFDFAVDELVEQGFVFIGLDHFAKPHDEMAVAHQKNTLYRNFQGYTTHDGLDLFGLGVTAISDVAGVYKQNHKKLNQYYDPNLNWGADKFKVCDEDDIRRRQIIKDIMCTGQVSVSSYDYALELNKLEELRADGLVQVTSQGSLTSIQVTELGRYLVRNIASVFDAYLAGKGSHRLFSRSL